jgi:DNA-binding protein HU-beta
MNKTEFVQKVAQVSGLSVKDCRKAVEAIFNTDDGSRGVIAEELVQDHKITLPGFGTFETRTRQGREGRNPRTREPMRIPPSKVPTFRPGKNLKGLVHV